MFFGRAQNRRRAETAQRTERVTGASAPRPTPGALGVLIIGLFVAALVGARALRQWAVESPSFGLRTLTFHGLARATEGELVKLSGLAQGANLWTLDTDALVRSMGGHPWVRHVEVARRFPATVVVSVEEHTPEAFAALGDLYLVNGHGEPFKKVGPEDAFDLVLITGMTREVYMQDPAAAAERFRQALHVAEAYQASAGAARDRLSEVHMGPEGFSLFTGQGQEVRLGEGLLPEKLDRLARVREELSRRNLVARVIRLDNRSRPGWVAVEVGDAVKRAEGSKQ